MEKKNEVKVGDRVKVFSKRYNEFSKKTEKYESLGIVESCGSGKYLIRFTSPTDEKDFKKYVERSEFKVLKRKD